MSEVVPLRDCRASGRSTVYRVADERLFDMLALAAALVESNCEHLGSCKRIGLDWI